MIVFNKDDYLFLQMQLRIIYIMLNLKCNSKSICKIQFILYKNLSIHVVKNIMRTSAAVFTFY